MTNAAHLIALLAASVSASADDGIKVGSPEWATAYAQNVGAVEQMAATCRATPESYKSVLDRGRNDLPYVFKRGGLPVNQIPGFVALGKMNTRDLFDEKPDLCSLFPRVVANLYNAYAMTHGLKKRPLPHVPIHGATT